MLDGSNKSIDVQIEILKEILYKNEKLVETLKVLEEYAKNNPKFRNYYVGAGGVNQTVFNYYHGYDINYGIKDFDIVYYDNDESYEAEDIIIKDLERKLSHIDTSFDIKNQGRVYIWYNEKYGTNRDKYTSVEDAISSWGATVTCIGVRLENNELKVYCPYGLNDIFSMIIRPVKKDFEKESYIKRASKWKEKWKKLKIIKW
ncbi:MAG: nucleotidyltransferase family protein [Bacilli bacterium]|nr:nucleotidyltransferase family protein [Bacilli bacterium]